MKYRDLPESGGVQPQMLCRDCSAGPFSAQRGDYFWCEPEDTVLCGCGGEMILVRHVDHYEPV